MADELDSILFSADWDPEQFVQGVGAMMNSLTKLEEKEKQLQKSVEASEKALSDKAEQAKKLEATIISLDKTSKTYAEDQAKLRAEIEKTKQEEQALVKAMDDQKKAQDAIVQSGDKLKASYEKVRSSVAEIQKIAGKPISVNINQADILHAMQDIKGVVAGFIDGVVSGFGRFDDELKAKLLTAKDDIEVIKAVMADARADMQMKFAPDSAEMKEFEEQMQLVNKVIESYNTITEEGGVIDEKSGKQKVSLRARIKELRDELTRLEDAGLSETEVFRQTELEAAKLTDQYGDMQQRIRILASDTKALDFGVAAVQTAASVFQVATGAMELFGVSSEDAQKAQAKLLAIMNLVQGLEQLQNLLLRENTLLTLGADAATKIYTATQRALAVALGTSAGMARALRVALLTTGVGVLVAGIGYLISKIVEWTSSTEDAAEAQDKLKKAIDGVNDSLQKNLEFTDQAGKVAVLQAKIRGASAAEINKIQRETIEKEISNLEVAENKKKLLFNQSLSNDKLTNDERNKLHADALSAEKETSKKRNELILFDLQFEADQAEKRRQSSKKDQSIENVYQQKLQDLKSKLAAVAASGLLTDETIRKKIEEDVIKGQMEIDSLRKQKKLTKGQADNLKALIGVIGQAELTKELDDYYKKVAEARQQVEDKLQNLNFDLASKRIENIQNEFKQESAAIELEYRKQAVQLENERRDALKDLDEKLKSVTSPLLIQSYNDQKQKMERLYDQLLLELTAETNRKRQELAAKIFQDNLNALADTFTRVNDKISVDAGRAIHAATEEYLKGTLSYEQFEKRMTEINRQENEARLRKTKASIQEQIAAIDIRSTNPLISDKESDDLDKQRTGLVNQLTDINKQIDEAVAGDKKGGDDAVKVRMEKIQGYVSGFSQLAQSVVSMWQTANEAEQKSLDRSIALQERRLQNAQRIAEKGNATYLKMEEDKQQELLLKQENAARRQIAINAAVQGSQLLVAITGAVAKIATPGIGIPETIASIGIIAGALASGFALVKTLQQNQPTFAEGDPYVRRDARKNISRLGRQGEPAGTDTIPAWLDEGEAVTDKKTNALYHPVIEAIHNGTVPPDYINGVVNSYPRYMAPMHDYDRMSQAAAIHITHDSRLAGVMSDSLREMKKLRKDIRSLGVNINLDHHGFAVSMNAAFSQINRNKKA